MGSVLVVSNESLWASGCVWVLEAGEGRNGVHWVDRRFV